MSETKKVLTLSDDVIVMIRELIQLALLTGTSVTDHFRELQLVESDGKIVPDEDYVVEYNKTLETLSEQAEAKIKEMNESWEAESDEKFSLDGLKTTSPSEGLGLSFGLVTDDDEKLN